MRPSLLFVSLMVSCCIYSQQKFEDASIAEAEMKSAMKRMLFRANANTGNYDLRYHRLEFNLDPAVNFISGDVTSYYVAKENMSQIVFDLDDNLTVSQVTQDGSPLTFSQNANDELVITLPQVQNQGVLDSVTVSYSGSPASSGFGSFEQTTHNSDPIIWTLSEPYGAKTWWPCKQDLVDKIDSIDVYITNPQFNPGSEEYFAVSNGIEQSQVVDMGSKTTRFKHKYPIPAYLIAIAVTNYEIFSLEVTNNGNPFDIVNYVFPESLADAQLNTPVTLEIMDLFINLFEPYPFENEKYGHAEFTRSGGMEHTTVSFMGNYSRNLIAHELAHQWFGNKITCGSWKDIWLNEGFATYLSGLVVEALDDNAAFTSWKEFRVNHITSQTDGYVYLQDSDTTSVSRIFNSRLSYSKGAMLLHMLRKKLGDTDFYQGVQDYLVHPDLSYNYAKTEDFIPIMEQASGQDLTEFFNDWLFNQGYPSYNLEWEPISPVQVRIVLSQTQSHPSVSFFEAGVPVRLTGTGGETQDVVLDHNADSQQFFVGVAFEVADVIIDPEFDLISRDNQVSLGIETVIPPQELKVFPNPANSLINIRKPSALEVKSVRIFSISGQLISEFSFTSEISFEAYSEGLYFLQFDTDQGIINKSVVKH